MAETAASSENKAIFLNLASRWHKLAGEAESKSYKPIGDRKPSPGPSHC